jgi:predicted Zn-dependent protease
LHVYLQQTFPDFAWHLSVGQRQELIRAQRVEPVVLLDYGNTERDIKHWDFAFLITPVDLISHYKPYAFGTPSRSINVAVMSTAGLDPQGTQVSPSSEDQATRLSTRLRALAMHLFGHLNGLLHQKACHSYMYDLQTVDDLDHMTTYSPAHVQRLRTNLHEVADMRLEEDTALKSMPPCWFYVRGIWTNWDDICSAIWQAKPWEFPFRLSRLTTAAISALLVLLMTAEVWDLGLNQPPTRVVGLSLVVLCLTSAYILKRQQLLLRRQSRRLSEQTVVTNIAITVVVVLGRLTTYGTLWLGALSCALLLFTPGWSKSGCQRWVPTCVRATMLSWQPLWRPWG